MFIRLGLNAALTHQNRSYSDSETKVNVEAQNRKQRGEATGRGLRQLKINTTKKGTKQIICVWYLDCNLFDLNGHTRNMEVPADLACKINITHKPPYNDKVLTTGEP